MILYNTWEEEGNYNHNHNNGDSDNDNNKNSKSDSDGDTEKNETVVPMNTGPIGMVCVEIPCLRWVCRMWVEIMLRSVDLKMNMLR